MSTANQSSQAWAASGVAALPRRVSEDQFERWVLANENNRAEWCDGEVQMMSPASFEHFDLNGWLFRLLGDYVEGRELGGIVAFDCTIRLGGGKSRRLPDALYLPAARRALLQATHLDGAPDLVVEIISRDSQARDYREKYLEYEAAGVREYWIVDPFSKHIEAYSLDEGGKFMRLDDADGKIVSTVLEGFHLRNEWLWATPRPTALSVLKQLGIS